MIKKAQNHINIDATSSKLETQKYLIGTGKFEPIKLLNKLHFRFAEIASALSN